MLKIVGFVTVQVGVPQKSAPYYVLMVSVHLVNVVESEAPNSVTVNGEMVLGERTVVVHGSIH